MSTTESLRFFYDYASPYAYLGASQIERVAATAGVAIAWRPILLGALFKRIGTPQVPLFAAPEPKRRYLAQDLRDWAAHWQVPLRWPSRFPMNTVAALRLTLAVPSALRPALTRRLFSAYWVEDRDLQDRAVLAQALAQAGGDPEALQRALAPDPEVRQALFDTTEEAFTVGVCGVPSMLVRGHLFWGQDRLDLVERTLSGWDPPRG